ncbi:MAG: hypothetical protein C4522_10705 [Desulfobacteraceae bacterium]|nr:MAG: hypothetical protein C4522_10705 [Desulfobacteraceae bacterium]
MKANWWKATRMFFGSVVFVTIAAPSLIISAFPGQAAAAQTAVVVSAAGDYSSGAHSIVSVEPVGGPRTITQDLVPSGSDMTVVAYGDHFYRMERSNANNITKFHIDQPDTPVWQYSTEGSETGSNPHDLVFAGESKAYLLRFGSSTIWIVNPGAANEADFKIGEIDLGIYADGDGKPEMHSGVILNGFLYVSLQRVDFSGGWGNYVYNTPWIAVFRTADDTEVETGQGDGTRKGIPLPMENPGAIQYLASNNTIYVQGIGQYTNQYTSGIATINPTTYEPTLILDDGDENNHPYGAITGMAIVSPTKGYFVGYAAWGDNTLYAFDPSDPNPAGTPVPGLANLGIGGMETGTYTDENNMLWICTSTYDSATWSLIDPKIIILNTETDTVDETIETNLTPLRVVFTGQNQAVPTASESNDDDDSTCFIQSAFKGFTK